MSECVEITDESQIPVQSKVEALVREVDAVRAREDMTTDEKAAEIERIESEISELRGGRSVIARGVGNFRGENPNGPGA